MSQTATKERPILMSAPMVNAILNGRKSMTRRVLKPQPPGEPIACERYFPEIVNNNGMLDAAKNEIFGVYGDDWGVACPYGGPGDRLWVRETFTIESFGAGVAQIRYHADNQRGNNAGVSDRKLPNRLGSVPSIHMPRHCSRITLEISEVRVERLQEISEADAIAEGAQCAGVPASLTNRGAFAKLWDSINGKKHPWASSPWVWVISFKRLP